MPKIAMLVMAGGLALLLGVVLAATRDAEAPVIEMVVPKAHAPLATTALEIDRPGIDGSRSASSRISHPGEIVHLPVFSADGVQRTRHVQVSSGLFEIQADRIQLLLSSGAVEQTGEMTNANDAR